MSQHKWSKRNKVNAKGRNERRSGRFSRIPHEVQRSKAYMSLTNPARSLLIELIAMENGKNNGSLYLGVRDAAARIGVSDLSVASRAFDELCSMGLIVCTVDAKFRGGSRNTSRARCWRLTFESGPEGKPATHDYREREPVPGTRAHKRMEVGLKALKRYRKAMDCDRFPVMDSNTLEQFGPASA